MNEVQHQLSSSNQRCLLLCDEEEEEKEEERGLRVTHADFADHRRRPRGWGGRVGEVRGRGDEYVDRCKGQRRYVFFLSDSGRHLRTEPGSEWDVGVRWREGENEGVLHRFNRAWR